MSRIYCIDTSSFLEAWRRSYHPDAFPSFWKKLDGLLADERLYSSQETLTELEKKDDDIFKWAKLRRAMFIDTDEEVWKLGMEIVAAYPKLLHNVKNRLNADAFLIAVAKLNGYCVVTEEDYGTDTKPKIPLICDALNVEHIKLLNFVLTEGWKF